MIIDLFAYTEVLSVADDVFPPFRDYLERLGTPCYLGFPDPDTLGVGWGIVKPGFVSLTKTPSKCVAKINAKFALPDPIIKTPMLGIQDALTGERELFHYNSVLFREVDRIWEDNPTASLVTFHTEMDDDEMATFIRRLRELGDTDFELFDTDGYLDL